MDQDISQRFCGREFTTEEVGLVQEVVRSCAGLSRTELAHTVSCSSLCGLRASRAASARA